MLGLDAACRRRSRSKSPSAFVGSCSDEEGDPLTITITQQPQKGTATVAGPGMPGYASVQYSASSAGADSFKFKASDGNSDSSEVTVTTTNVPAVNDPPQCWGSASPPLEVEVGDPPILAGSCFDDEGDPLTITITQQPQKGTAQVQHGRCQYSASSGAPTASSSRPATATRTRAR